MAKLCMGCMNPLPQGTDTCQVCGYQLATHPNPSNALPAASVLQEHYIVGRLMDETSDQLLYIGYDRQLKEPCFIQEFFPGAISSRGEDSSVQSLAGCERAFADHADTFRGTMRILARMRELPAIVPVYDLFEENGTIYAVSDYCEGMTLTKKIKLSGGRLPWSEARPLFMSLLSSLTRLNEAGICHLGICPDNILIGNDGKPRLRNFAIPAARQSGTDITPQLQTGYAAPEQYTLDSTSDAQADVYGVAATIFRTVTGNEPPAGNSRAKDSDDLFMPAEVAEELSQPVCIALFNALQVEPDNRTGTVAELRDQLSVEPHVSALVEEAEVDLKNSATEEAPEKAKKNNTALFVFLGCLAALLVIVVIFMVLIRGSFGQGGPDDSNQDLPTFSTSGTTGTSTDKQVSVENLVGQNYYTIRDTKLAGEQTIKLLYMMHSSKPAGTILNQDPAVGSVVDKGTEIKIIISSGQKSEKLAVPDVSGWQEAHAKLYLEALGFRVETVLLQISDYEKGLVDSTDPAIGTEKRIGDVITLRVSNVEQKQPEPEVSVDDQPSTDENPDNNDGGFFFW